MYVCEICLTQYVDKEKAKECEKCHKNDLKIVRMRYLPYKNDHSGLPFEITIVDKNGKETKYRK